MTIALFISIIGYTLLITVDLNNIGLNYFAIFMTTVGVGTPANTDIHLVLYALAEYLIGLSYESNQQCLDSFQYPES